MADDGFNWRFDLEKPKPKPGPGEYWGSDHLRLAETLYERGDYKRAFAKAVQAIESWPTNPEPYVVAGDALSKLDESDIGYLTHAFMDERNPEGFYEAALLHEAENGDRANVLRKLAEIAAECGNHRLAADRYEEATIYKPDRAMFFHHLAYHRSVATGELQTAPLQEALMLDPEALREAETDDRWEPWREQVDALVTEAKQLITDRADDTYHKAVETINRAEAIHYAARAHRAYS